VVSNEATESETTSPASSVERPLKRPLAAKQRAPIVFDLSGEAEDEEQKPAEKSSRRSSIKHDDTSDSLNDSFFRSPVTPTTARKSRFQQPPVYKGRDGRYYVAFFTNKYIFSNHFTCPGGVTVDGIEFPTTEHYYMYRKALFHNDASAAQKIRNTDDPKYAKRITAKFENFDVAGWKKIQYAIMEKACLSKFRQNPALRKELFRTASAVLVEASPSDRRWGVGLSIDNPDVADTSKWYGKNMLGNLLMQVRTTLATEYEEEFSDALSDSKQELKRRAIRR